MSFNTTLPAPGASFGLAACIGIAALAALLASLPGVSAHGLGWLPLAMALGIVAGNVWPSLPVQGVVGLGVARTLLMRTGIALYGLSIGIDELTQMSWSTPVMALLIVVSTLVLALWIGRRLGLDTQCALLIGMGSAICGAAAVAATESVIGGRPRYVSAAVAAVVVFGTLGMYLLPLLYPFMHLSASSFGLWIGLSVHELGHVVAAASMVGPGAEASALMEKMLRVFLLAPAVICVALYDGRNKGRSGGFKVPLFLWGFVAAIFLNALGVLPAWLHAAGVLLAQALLALGLAALGASTRLSDIRQAGSRVWILAGLLWLHLLLSSLFMLEVLT